MADILIRGMEMPTQCGNCPISTNTRRCTILWREFGDPSKRLEDCPLVPLPEGHGRLGDLEIAEAILHNKAFDLAGASAEYNALNWAMRQIKALPTIVPAEGGLSDGQQRNS